VATGMLGSDVEPFIRVRHATPISCLQGPSAVEKKVRIVDVLEDLYNIACKIGTSI